MFRPLPLGLSFIAAIAHDLKADVSVIYGSGFEKKLDAYLSQFKPDIVGIQTFVNNMNLTYSIARDVKSRYPDSIVVLGGVHATNFPENVLESPYIDLVVPGEAEGIFKQLLLNLDDFQNVPGVYWQDDMGKVHKNEGGTTFENLDDLPPIPYHLFYTPGNTPTGHILYHRGCKYKCSQCPFRFTSGISIRAHSVDRISEMIRELKENYLVDEIEFYDENFIHYPDFVFGICETFKELGLSWRCCARIEEFTTDLVRVMSTSGCREIIFGLGSGVKRVQDVLRITFDLDDARRMLREITRSGIRTVAAFTLGNPTETKQEVRETVKYALGLNVSRVRFEFSTPIPGTILHQRAMSGGRFIIDSWDEYVYPGQLIYQPAGWSLWELKTEVFKAKAKAKLAGLLHRK